MSRFVLIPALLLVPILAHGSLFASDPSLAKTGKTEDEIVRRETLEGPVAATIVRVRDGDSIEVLAHVWPGQRIAVSVRLRGIDAPELRARCPKERAMAERAKQYLMDLTGGEPISLRQISGGKYFGRILADVRTAKGVDVAREMLSSGFAVQYRKRKSRDWCAIKPASLD